MKKERNYLAKLFARKSWRRVVRSLSCLVVFCTTYALILPAFTTEAKSYCGHQEHEHGPDCYKQILSCPKEEHTHTDECFDTEGNLICNKEEHVHGSECYRELLDCTTEIHEHSLICFSNPNADLESAADWEKSLPTREERKETTRENVVATAWSQQNVTESRNNYQVDDETDIRGISRYGQWDQDPYEDNWSGSFARFVMHYGGVKDDTDQEKHIYPNKDLIEWMNNLSDHDLLVHIDEAREGDIVFINDSEDEIRAGVILDTDTEEGSFRAMMGDWMDQVSVQKFFRNDSKIHSAFLIPVDDDPKEEEPDDSQETENPSKDETEKDPEEPDKEKDPETEDKENTQSPNNVAKPSDQDKTDQDNPDSGSDKKEPDSVYTNSDKDQTSKTEEAEKDKNLTVLTTEADDGSLIKAEFDKDALPENAVLMATRLKNGSKELDELDAKVKEKFSKELEENCWLDYIAYDISFFLSDGNELQEIEPKKPVHISILLGEKIQSVNSKIVHLKSDGTLEDLTDKEDSNLYPDAQSGLKKKPWVKENKNSKNTDQVIKSNSDSNDSKEVDSQADENMGVKRSDRKEDSKVIESPSTVSDQPDTTQFESMIEFNSDSFSTISYVQFPESGYTTVYDAAALYSAIYDQHATNIRLGSNIDLQSGGQKKAVYIDGRSVVIDLNGHFIKNEGSGDGQNIFVIKNNGQLTLTNTRDIADVSSNEYSDAHWNASDNGVNWVQYWENNNQEDANKGSTLKRKVTGVGVLYSPHTTAIKIDGSGKLTIEKNAIVDSNGGIDSNNGILELKDSFVIGDPTISSTALKTVNGELTIKSGAIAGHKKWGGVAGAAIQTNGSKVILDNGVKIVNNACFDLNETFGGAIALSGHSIMTINEATIAYNLLNINNDNNDNSPRWTGGAGIGVMGNSELTINNGALIQNNKSWMLGGGICLASDGKDRNSQVTNAQDYSAASKLYMYGGTIKGNIAHHREGGGLALAAKHWNYAYLYGGTFEDNQTETTGDWGGGGIFVGEYSYLVMPNGASVYNNTAQGFGGGIAGCSTGRLFMDEKVTMANNTGYGNKFTGTESSKDEPVFAFSPTFKDYGGANDFFGCLHSMVSGKFWDGTESSIGAQWNGSADSIRLTDINDGYVMANELLGLSSNVKDPDTVSKITNHGVIIRDNKSSIHGAGILINGYMIGGDVEKLYVGDTFGLTADKSYKDESGAEQQITNGQFEFEVLNKQMERVSYGTTDSNGEINFNNRVVFDSEPDVSTFTFYVREISSNSDTDPQESMNTEYDKSVYRLKVNITDVLLNSFIIYRKDADGNLRAVTLQERKIKINSIDVDKGLFDKNNQFTVTEAKWRSYSYNNESSKMVELKKSDVKTFNNKVISKRKLEVKKVWSDGKPHANDSVQVDLYMKYSGETDDQAVKLDDQSKTLSADNNWKAEWADLPTYDQKGWIEYFVRENLPNNLYIPEYNTEFISQDVPTTIQVTGSVWVPVNSGDTKLGSENVLISDNGYAVNSELKSWNLSSIKIDSSKRVTLADGTKGYLQDAVVQSEKVTHNEYGFNNTSNNGAIRFIDTDAQKYLSYGKHGDYGSFELMVRGTGDHHDRGYPYRLSNQLIQFQKKDTNDWVYLTEANGLFGVNSSENQANVLAYELQTRTYEVSDTTKAYFQKVTITNTPNQQAEFGLRIKKVSDDDKTEPLKGAEFKIAVGTEELKFNLADGVYTSDPNGKESVVISDDNGLINIKGLKAATYTITEVKAPAGYMIDQNNSVREIVIDGDNLENPGDLTFKIEIKNKLETYELPETGGSGSNWFVYCGTLMMFSCLIYLIQILKRRKAGESTF